MFSLFFHLGYTPRIYVLNNFIFFIHLTLFQKKSLGFRVWGLGFGVWGLGVGVWGLGFGVLGLGF
jgi:hypothetical protein